MHRGPQRLPWALATGLAAALITLTLHEGQAGVGREPRAVGAATARTRGLGVVPRPATRLGGLGHRAPSESAAPPGEVGGPPAAFLIYLLDGSEPIVVNRYLEENGEIHFQKYGGLVRIPTYEILKIVPDEPERRANLPPPVPVDTAGAPLRPEPDLYLTMRGGGNLKVVGLTPQGDSVRVAVPSGSFTVPRSEILGVVRVPPGSEVPEAWLSLQAGDEAADGAPAARSAGLVPASPDPRLVYQASDRPHVLRLATGQLMRVEAFWVEDGELHFRRLGGVVSVALNEVLRVFPDELAPVRGRTPVRFARWLGRDLLEVAVRSGYHRVRLLGVAPLDARTTANGRVRTALERGDLVHLEFDRQRYDADGNWLAYVFLPSGRMLNAELIRLGLARPASDGRNVRYLDLLHEVAGAEAFTAESH